MEDATNGRGLMPSLFSRIAAMLLVLALMGSLSLACIGVVAIGGPILAHGTNVEHADGKILNVGPGRDFWLQTATGKTLFFLCGDQCRASLGHLLRHKNERAHTDVYYIQGPGKNLMAVDVD